MPDLQEYLRMFADLNVKGGRKPHKPSRKAPVVSDLTVAREPSSQGSARDSLRSVPDIRPLYILPKDSMAEEVLIPSFSVATRVDCMVGFFSSEVLASLAPGLATYIRRSQNSFRLIISPLLRVEDQAAIEDSLMSEEEVADRILEDLIVTEDLLQQHTLKCLSWLLRTGRMEIKVALMKDALFHPKVWLFHASDDVMAVHGSSNVTQAGIRKNIEQVAVSKSWEDPHQRYITDKLCYEFDHLWDNKDDNCIVIAMPEAVRQHLLRTYSSEMQPTENELRALYGRATGLGEETESYESAPMPITPGAGSVPRCELSIPAHLDLHHGPFAHQGKALDAWENANRRGFLSMATGSGKTITALAGATRLQKEVDALLVIISAPYKPLVSQWLEEVSSFGVKPLSVHGSSAERAHRLDLAIRGLHTGVSKVEVLVVTEKFLTGEQFRRIFDALPKSVTSLLIADEAHNLGKRSFITNTPDRFDFRLGLSATPERQYDPEGTAALFKFFGRPVFEFSLQEAIGVCLVRYNYYIHQVELSDAEFDEWKSLTERLIRKGFEGDADASDAGGLSKEVERLLFARRRVIESAENKVDVLCRLLRNRTRDDIKHVLVYATDKNGGSAPGSKRYVTT